MKKPFIHEMNMNNIKENKACAINEKIEDIKLMYAQSILTGQVTMDRRAEVYWLVSSYRGE